MTALLNQSRRIHALAADLGLDLSKDPVGQIVAHCKDEVEKCRSGFQECATLAELLDLVANRVGTKFETVYTDEDLSALQDKYCSMGELRFVTLREDLDSGTLGVTYERMAAESWEPPFVSVIDCRGNKGAKEYFTKWHEIAHLLVLTDATRAVFHGTHAVIGSADPEEKLMDVIAGTFGFYEPFIRPHLNGTLSFERIDELRAELCPEASYQAALLGFIRHWPCPCLLVRAELNVKSDEKANLNQECLFDFRVAPKEVLRAVRVTPSQSAREARFSIHRNMRVPDRSVISQVYRDVASNPQVALEDLGWWESSTDGSLDACQIRVEARGAGNGVDALVTFYGDDPS